MKPLTYGIWLVAIVVFAWDCTLAARANRMATAVVASSQPRADHELTPPERSASPAIETAASPARRSVSPPAARAETWKPTPRTAVERKALLANALPHSPDARAAQDGIRIRMRYHAFYAALGLTAAEIARFEKAMAGKMDPFANIVGSSPEQEAVLRDSVARTMDRLVRETLGEAAVPRMREFIATADLREVAEKLAANTFHSDTPLTGPQADRLVQLCLDCRLSPGSGIRNLPDAVDWEKVLPQAQAFLSPAQLSALRAMTDQRRFDQEFKHSTGLPYRSPVRNF